MAKHRDFAPLERLPATWLDAFHEFISTAAFNWNLRIKPTNAAVLEVPAGAVNDMVGLAIEGKFRYVSASKEQAGAGAARTVDVFATTGANDWEPGVPGEIDNTDYNFNLAIVDEGNAPVGVTHSRKVAKAAWDGAKFTSITHLIEPVKQHAPSHRPGSTDPIEWAPYKGWVRVATTANVNLAAPGAAVDGVNLVAGDRVLVRAQDAGAENGIYIWNGAAVPMTRAPDADASSDFEFGQFVQVREGAPARADTFWALKNDGAIVLGATALVYAIVARADREFVTWAAFTRDEDQPWPANTKEIGSFPIPPLAPGQTVAVERVMHVLHNGSNTTAKLQRRVGAGAWADVAAYAAIAPDLVEDEIVSTLDVTGYDVVRLVSTGAGTGKGGHFAVCFRHRLG